MSEEHAVLIVLTSETSMGSTGAPTGFWMEELATPYYAFRDAGYRVKLASPRGGEVKPDPRSLEDEAQTDATRRFQGDADAKNALASTAVLSTVEAEDYDAILFPGGHGPMFDLASDVDAGKLAEAFHDAGKVVAAFCHGPAALITARNREGTPLVAGKRLTAFSNEEERAIGMDEELPFLLEDRLKELGAVYSSAPPTEAHVIVDSRLITGQNPASAPLMTEAVLEALEQSATDLTAGRAGSTGRGSKE